MEKPFALADVTVNYITSKCGFLKIIDEFYPMLTPQEKQVSVNVPDGNIFVQSNTEKTVFTVVLPQKQEKDKLSA